MAHSIFIRDVGHFGGRRPQLLAYEIGNRSEAESLVRSIAGSYRDHGLNPATATYWFRHNDSVREIYVWPDA
ncbi:hypothetical protein [Methylobacterium nigriterrae]|uniref:hypothetical protein n=1 Tax=Methylobacterium nigriterrae TaxID=3127512 RepID=UPI00301349D9